MDNKSDPDIFISNKPKISKSNYIWRTTSIGAVEINIHPIDKDYSDTWYYIGICGGNDGVNKFTLEVITTDPSNLIGDYSSYKYT